MGSVITDVVELCAGQGRNISTIIKRLKPRSITAVDYDKQCIQEIEERWGSYQDCFVKGLTQFVSQFIDENKDKR